MSASVHLQRRFLESGGPGGISSTAIGLIVGIGLVPSIILIWVVIFLFFAYPNDRNFCCMKRKKHKDNIPDMLESQVGNVSSEETLQSKSVYEPPKRPFVEYSRTESGSSSDTRRVAKNRPETGVSKTNTRMSSQSNASVTTMQGAQEPQRFI